MMDEVIRMRGNQRMSTVEITKIIKVLADNDPSVTPKQHMHILRDVRVLAEALDVTILDSTGSDVANLTCSNLDSEIMEEYYLNPRNKKCTMYTLDKITTINLITGYSIKIRNAINKRWMELEQQQQQQQIPQTYTEALRIALQQAEENDRLQLELNQKDVVIEQKDDAIMHKEHIIEAREDLIEAQAPMIEEYHEILNDIDEVETATELGQRMGLTAQAFNRMLRDDNIHRKVHGSWVLYAEYKDMGYVIRKTKKINGKTRCSTYWTQRGIHFIRTKYKHLFNAHKKLQMTTNNIVDMVTDVRLCNIMDL